MKLDEVITSKLEKLLENSPVAFADLVREARKETGMGLHAKAMVESQKLGLTLNGKVPNVVKQVVLNNVRGRGIKLYIKVTSNQKG